MAVSFVATKKHFQGDSTDDKPLTDVPEGSTFHTVDTGEEFVYHNGMWELDLRSIRVLDGVLWI